MWVAFLIAHFGALLLLPHRHYSTISSVNIGLQFLLFLLCYKMARKDDKTFRPVTVNLTIFFGFSILMYLSIFVGTVLFTSNQYASVYYHECVNKFGVNAVLVIAVVYLIVDYRFQKWRTITKYAITLSILAALMVFLYLPYLQDPLYLYRTEEYSRYLELKSAHSSIIKESGTEPMSSEVIERALMNRGLQVDKLNPEYLARERGSLSELTKYLAGGNELILFWKPLNLNTVYVNAVLLGLIAIFYLLKLFNDRPHGAYFEKIIFLFFLFCAIEILHAWAYTQSADERLTDAKLYYAIHEVGQYLTIVVLLALVYVCSVRLRFILSPVGRYYERQIVLNPERVSRWRDEIDRLILKAFLHRAPFSGRFGILETEQKPQPPNRKGEA